MTRTRVAFSPRRSHWSVLGTVVFVLACSNGPHIQSIGIPLVYWTVDLRPLGTCGGSRQFAVIRAAKDVAIMRATATGTVTVPLAPSGGCTTTFPVALGVTDVNDDGIQDVIVVDTGCGSQVALGTSDCQYASQTWDTVFPTTLALPDVASFTCPGSSEVVALSSTTELDVLKNVAGAPMWMSAADIAFPLQQSASQEEVSDIAIPVRTLSSGGPGILFQRGSALSSGSCANLVDAGSNVTTDVGLRAGGLAFYGFDQWQAVDVKGCAEFALAIGLYPPLVSRAARHLRTMTFDATGYDTQRITDFDVDTVASISDGDHETGLVGIVTTTNGARMLQVGQLSCSGLQILSQSAVTGMPSDGRYAIRVTGTLAGDDVVLWWSDGNALSGMSVSTTGQLTPWTGNI